MDEKAKKIKIFFFDIDSTTLDHSISKVRESTMYALKALKRNGYKICISTSRSLDEMRMLPRDYVELFDGIITEAGALIIKDGQFVHKLINQEELLKGIGYLDENKITYRYVDEKGIGYLNQHDEDKEALFYRLYQMIPEVKKYEGERVTHILYYRHNAQNPLDLQKLMPNSQHIGMKIANEITPLNTNKGTAILQMAQLYGFDQEATCSFGDAGNDVDMIKMAAIGVAMGNGTAEVKAVADVIADDISKEGLYKALVELGFIERMEKDNC